MHYSFVILQRWYNLLCFLLYLERLFTKISRSICSFFSFVCYLAKTADNAALSWCISFHRRSKFAKHFLNLGDDTCKLLPQFCSTKEVEVNLQLQLHQSKTLEPFLSRGCSTFPFIRLCLFS